MIAGIAALALISYGTLVSRGNSDTAAFVDQQVQQGRRRLRDSVVFELLGMGTFDGLRQIYRECLEPNWDGYGALPVSEGAYWLAHQFLEALPLGTPPPSFGAEPDGQFTLEWHRSPRRTLS